MKTALDLICPVYYLPYIFNADTENLTAEEVNNIEDILTGYSCFSFEEDVFFSHRNDFNKFGCDCVVLTVSII